MTHTRIIYTRQRWHDPIGPEVAAWAVSLAAVLSFAAGVEIGRDLVGDNQAGSTIVELRRGGAAALFPEGHEQHGQKDRTCEGEQDKSARRGKVVEAADSWPGRAGRAQEKPAAEPSQERKSERSAKADHR